MRDESCGTDEIITKGNVAHRQGLHRRWLFRPSRGFRERRRTSTVPAGFRLAARWAFLLGGCALVGEGGWCGPFHRESVLHGTIEKKSLVAGESEPPEWTPSTHTVQISPSLRPSAYRRAGLPGTSSKVPQVSAKGDRLECDVNGRTTISWPCRDRNFLDLPHSTSKASNPQVRREKINEATLTRIYMGSKPNTGKGRA